MSKVSWYWHRLRAMTPMEMALHARKKARQAADARHQPDWSSAAIESSGAFPILPLPSEAPRRLREALAADVDEILSGRWRAFGHLPIQVDDPPRWHTDYLARVDCSTDQSAFDLDHRSLPNGADVKLIWELSRWYQLVRLAMAAYVLEDRRAAEKCVEWLEDWVKHNPPFRGWNWTSALEAGMRLIQFTWIDALLVPIAKNAGLDARLNALRAAILPPHVWFAWRYKSFGSSANNHLLGEIVGLILAITRWPALAQWAAPLKRLGAMWEREVILQFAEDGGNKEQALNYQLFSFEFCWQARLALLGAGQKISDYVERRLTAAASFLRHVLVDEDQWDYGDSDNGCVTPFFATDITRIAEWRRWAAELESESISYWLGSPPLGYPPAGTASPPGARTVEPWWFFPNTGIAIADSGFWRMRWDLSPLGYLSTAAHGHLDALHLSVWYKGVAFIVDPGTGAYYADEKLRTWLASHEAHNGPAAAGEAFPQRLGPFLWSAHHSFPRLNPYGDGVVASGGFKLQRSIAHRISPLDLTSPMISDEWTVEDHAIQHNGTPADFSVRWQFAPGTWVQRQGERRFKLNRKHVAITLEVSDDWAQVVLVEQPDGDAEGVVSSAFRRVEWAPYLKLVARPQAGQSCVFRTTFVASAAP